MKEKFVVLKDMAMPKDCDSCPFYEYYDDYIDECEITGEKIQGMELGKRHSKCPLREIELDYKQEDAGDFQSGYNFALDEIKEQLEEE